jgi:nucleotide-binding universal stress UspA family protein
MARVLIATDGSESAIRSAQRAVGVLGDDHDYWVLVVVPPSATVMAAGYAAMGMEAVAAPAADPAAEARAEAARRREADEVLDRTLDAIHVDAGRRVSHGDPGREICRIAGEDGFDLVVVGSHGAGLVRRVLVGSVSHYVLHHAPCPVFVMREVD